MSAFSERLRRAAERIRSAGCACGECAPAAVLLDAAADAGVMPEAAMFAAAVILEEAQSTLPVEERLPKMMALAMAAKGIAREAAVASRPPARPEDN